MTAAFDTAERVADTLMEGFTDHAEAHFYAVGLMAGVKREVVERIIHKVESLSIIRENASPRAKLRIMRAEVLEILDEELRR